MVQIEQLRRNPVKMGADDNDDIRSVLVTMATTCYGKTPQEPKVLLVRPLHIDRY